MWDDAVPQISLSNLGHDGKGSRKTSQPVWRFLARLRETGHAVRSEEGRLRVSAPSGVLTAELREELTARKAEILDFLRESRVFNGDDGPLLRPVPRGQPLPLSFAQQRLWMVEQMNPRSIRDIMWACACDSREPCPFLPCAGPSWSWFADMNRCGRDSRWETMDPFKR